MKFFSLYIQYFKKDVSAIFFTFFFPALMVIILGPIMPANYILPGLFLLPAITTAFFFTPRAIFEWRNSSLIKRIGISPIKTQDFLLSIFFVSLLTSVMGFLVTFGFTVLISETTSYFKVIGVGTEGVKGALSFAQVQWGHLVGMFLGTACFAITTAIAIGMWAKKESQAILIGILLYFLVSFLGGIFFDISMIEDVALLNYVSYALPWTWTTSGFVLAWAGELKEPLDIALGYAFGYGGTLLMILLIILKSDFSQVR